MKLSIFENDGTLGNAYRAVTFSGSARGSAWMNAEAQRQFWLQALAGDGWGITSLSLSRPTELANDVDFTLVLNALCDGRSNEELAAGMKASIEASGYADRVTIRHVRSDRCPDNVGSGGGAVVHTQPSLINGGNLATVNIPFPKDDPPNEGVGIAKGIDIKTWVLLGIAGVLILKRL